MLDIVNIASFEAKVNELADAAVITSDLKTHGRLWSWIAMPWILVRNLFSSSPYNSHIVAQKIVEFYNQNKAKNINEQFSEKLKAVTKKLVPEEDFEGAFTPLPEHKGPIYRFFTGEDPEVSTLAEKPKYHPIPAFKENPKFYNPF